MPLTKALLLYVLTIPVFFLVDMIWLGLVARNFYRKYLGCFLSPKVNWPAAILFYLLFIVGILIFAVLPSLEKRSLSQAILLGALFGFFCYATYDLTNLATMKEWPLRVTVVDLIWGIVLSGLVSAISHLIGTRLQ